MGQIGHIGEIGEIPLQTTQSRLLSPHSSLLTQISNPLNSSLMMRFFTLLMSMSSVLSTSSG